MSRVAWAAMLAGQLIFFITINRLWNAGRFDPRPDLSRTLFLVNVGVFASVLAAGWFLRRSIARPEIDGMISPRVFARATIVFIALCGLPVLLGVVTMAISLEMWPTIVVPALAFTIQLLNFPSGALVRGVGDRQ
ncbi:MAG TPA: hypothetical protein VLI90_08240 [Tepidisphaeraceae bacterium]|nr:hypothetical protein [Tepidisphaeraceae bacterium]